MICQLSVQTNGGEIAVFTNKRQKNAPVVILLHGLASNHTTWDTALEALEKQGINAYAPDLRGHGLSDMRKVADFYTFERSAQDLEALITQEKIVRPFLVGYSYGGPIACLLAARHQVAGLFLMSSNMRSPLLGSFFKPFNSLAYHLVRMAAWLVRPQFRRHYIYYQYGEATSYWQTLWIGLNTMPLSVNLWMLSQVLTLNLTDVLPQISAPTLLVHALDDPFLSEAEVATMIRLLSQATSEVPEHKSHFIASRDQDGTVAALINFIQTYADRTY